MNLNFWCLLVAKVYLLDSLSKVAAYPRKGPPTVTSWIGTVNQNRAIFDIRKTLPTITDIQYPHGDDKENARLTNDRPMYAEEYEGVAPYEEVGLDEMDYDGIDDCFYYPCPCGDRFVLSSEEYDAGRRIATCPSCSLILKVK
jgi:diphthamide biosynthesis protein 3